jgi:hypothetical protein
MVKRRLQASVSNTSKTFDQSTPLSSSCNQGEERGVVIGDKDSRPEGSLGKGEPEGLETAGVLFSAVSSSQVHRRFPTCDRCITSEQVHRLSPRVDKNHDFFEKIKKIRFF